MPSSMQVTAELINVTYICNTFGIGWLNLTMFKSDSITNCGLAPEADGNRFVCSIQGKPMSDICAHTHHCTLLL